MNPKPAVVGDVLGRGHPDESFNDFDGAQHHEKQPHQMTPQERMHMLRGCNLKIDCYGAPLKQPPESGIKPNHVPFDSREYVKVLTKTRSMASQIKGFNSRVNIPKEDFPMFGKPTGRWAMGSYLEQARENHIACNAVSANIKKINHGIHGFGFLYHDTKANEEVHTGPRMQKQVSTQEGFYGAEKAPGSRSTVYHEWGRTNKNRDVVPHVDWTIPEKPAGMNDWKQKYRTPPSVYNNVNSRHDIDWKAVKESCSKVNASLREGTPDTANNKQRRKPQW
eukprot:CAMPEP_0198212722 /NCGR_PEP_ID=MMETSP1445-20131203/27353_1 /TAXON_ID=36898 /ORGANISM="Pyramimonas sp., Strain CCMP2087" /LENGTH=278 /DNA_ID=CAMNT_0043887247 /DNA_START=159 /DNA_END=992 /DNA_ORIENTATION=+